LPPPPPCAQPLGEGAAISKPAIDGSAPPVLCHLLVIASKTKNKYLDWGLLLAGPSDMPYHHQVPPKMGFDSAISNHKPKHLPSRLRQPPCPALHCCRLHCHFHCCVVDQLSSLPCAIALSANVASPVSSFSVFSASSLLRAADGLQSRAACHAHFSARAQPPILIPVPERVRASAWPRRN
jgi:hypothetical protein